MKPLAAKGPDIFQMETKNRAKQSDYKISGRRNTQLAMSTLLRDAMLALRLQLVVLVVLSYTKVCQMETKQMTIFKLNLQCVFSVKVCYT